MKTLMVVLIFAMVACAMCQYYGSYGYGYNTYTPGARVSHYAQSSNYAPVYGAWNYGHGAYPYRAY